MMMTPEQLAKTAEEAAKIKAAEEAEEKMYEEWKAENAEANVKLSAEDLKNAEWLALPAKRAMIDLGAAFTYSSVLRPQWSDPTMDGPTGWHNAYLLPGHDADWLEVDMPGEHLYQVSKFSW